MIQFKRTTPATARDACAALGPTAPEVAALVADLGADIERRLAALAAQGLDLSIRPYVGTGGLIEEAAERWPQAAEALHTLLRQRGEAWRFLVTRYGAEVARAALQTARRERDPEAPCGHCCQDRG